jgi:hypothetical protein
MPILPDNDSHAAVHAGPGFRDQMRGLWYRAWTGVDGNESARNSALPLRSSIVSHPRRLVRGLCAVTDCASAECSGWLTSFGFFPRLAPGLSLSPPFQLAASPNKHASIADVLQQEQVETPEACDIVTTGLFGRRAVPLWGVSCPWAEELSQMSSARCSLATKKS